MKAIYRLSISKKNILFKYF